MEKILLAVNAHQLNKETIDFACYIARLTGSSLSAMLLEGLPGSGLQEQPLPQPSSSQVSFSGSAAMTGVSGSMVTLSPETEYTNDPARFFRDTCAAQNVKCYIYRNRHMPLYEIVAETRFADLLITDADISFEAVKEPSPTLFVRTLLAEAECPVIVAPRNFDRVDEIVFAYDGSASSVFAIKQFTYLFPGLDNRTATLLHVREHGDWTAEEKRRIGD
ncbi:MAG: hypothetical protein JST39_03450, partial [Bacteroidetes bacterium]|nr:hypothetical protein [Bacteroidota bacterium]